MSNALQAAMALREAGIVCIPVKDDKTPKLGAWRKYMSEQPTEDQVRSWFAEETAIALVAGEVQCIDVDEKYRKGLMADFELRAKNSGLGDVWKKCVIQLTPSGGFHLVFRCEGEPFRNMKLAQKSADQGCEVLIETRGAGGYFLISPSTNYKVQQGSLTSLPTLTVDEREDLLDIARSFNEHLKRDEPEPTRQSGNKLTRMAQQMDGDITPGDDYDQNGDVESVLIRNGWTKVDSIHWRRPGKSKGISASLGHVPGRFYCFTTSTAFDPEKPYKPYAVYAMLEHDGDFQAACKALKQAGYGGNRTANTDPIRKEQPVLDRKDAAALPESTETDVLDQISIETGMTEMPKSFEEAKTRRPEVVIDGLVYAGSKMLIGGVAKAGKSHFVMDLVASLATGEKYLVWQPARAFKVLYVDFELHPFELRERTGGAFRWKPPETFGRLSLRGFPQIRDPSSLGKLFKRLQIGCYDVVVLDCLYKFNQAEDENSNSAMKAIGVWLDWLVAEFNVTPIIIHHFGKGSQGGRDMIDRFRGASSLVGDMDAMVSLTNHEEADHLIIESSVRSFRQTEPFVARWDYPKFILDESKDPTKHSKPGVARKASDEEILLKIPSGQENALKYSDMDLPVSERHLQRRISAGMHVGIVKIPNKLGRPAKGYFKPERTFRT